MSGVSPLSAILLAGSRGPKAFATSREMMGEGREATVGSLDRVQSDTDAYLGARSAFTAFRSLCDILAATLCVGQEVRRWDLLRFGYFSRPGYNSASSPPTRYSSVL